MLSYSSYHRFRVATALAVVVVAWYASTGE